MKRLISVFAFLLMAVNVYAGDTINPHTGNLQKILDIQESDGDPIVYAPETLKVTNGTLTDNADGTTSLNVPNLGSLAADLIPSADGTYDLGSSSKEWQDLYIDGTAYIDDMYYSGTYLFYNGEHYNWRGVIPVQQTWAQSTMKTPYNAANSPAPCTHFLEPYGIKQDGVYYCMWEYNTGADPYDWTIGGAYTTDPVNGDWTIIEPLLGPDTGAATNPDYVGVADPVFAYFEWADHPWHMWFDMYGDDGTSEDWTIGHAYADNFAGPWTKQDEDEDGVTDIVIGSDVTSFDGWNVSQPGHAPEMFVRGGVVHVINNAQGAGDEHAHYDAALYIASDNQGLGFEFDMWGPVTDDNTIDYGDSDRLGGIFDYQGILYATITSFASDDSGWIISSDGGRSWNQVGRTGDHDYYAGFFFDGTKIIAIPRSGQYFHELDLSNLSGTVATADNIQGTNIGIPMVHNVYKDYYIQGVTMEETLFDTGNVDFFDSVEVGDAVNGYSVDIHRNAATETDTKMTFYISNSMNGVMDMSDSKTLYIGNTGIGELWLCHTANDDIKCFGSSVSGETEELYLYGYRSGDAQRFLAMGCGVDAADTASFDGVSNYWLRGNVKVGEGTDGVDYTLTFDGYDDDCTLTYDEDNNILNMGDTDLTTTGNVTIGNTVLSDDGSDFLINPNSGNDDIYIYGSTGESYNSQVSIRPIWEGTKDGAGIGFRQYGGSLYGYTFIGGDALSGPRVVYKLNTGGKGEVEYWGSEPSHKFTAERASGGVAWDFFDLNIHNTTADSTTQAGFMGAYGNIADPPTVGYIYMSANTSESWSDAFFRITPSGRLGLGLPVYTDVTDTTLHIRQTGDSSGITLEGYDDLAASGMHMYWDNAGEFYMTTTSGTINFDDENLTTTGNVGIGTAPVAGYELSLPSAGKINAAGALKLNPNAEGDVELFSDTDVGNDESGKFLEIFRKAEEGDSYLRLYIDSGKNAVIYGASGATYFYNSGALNFQHTANADVTFFSSSGAGENRYLKQAGYITAAGDEVDVTWQVDDTDDYFKLEREAADILGFKIDMPVDLVDNDFTTTGNVGIGTAPVADYPLTFAQTATAKGIKGYGYDTASAEFFEIYVVTANNETYIVASDDMRFWSHGVACVTIDGGTSKMELNDNFSLALGNSGDALIYYDDANLQINAQNVGTGGTQFTGNVGIGTAPVAGYPLTLDQSADSQGVKLFGSTVATSYLHSYIDVNGYGHIHSLVSGSDASRLYLTADDSGTTRGIYLWATGGGLYCYGENATYISMGLNLTFGNNKYMEFGATGATSIGFTRNAGETDKGYYHLGVPSHPTNTDYDSHNIVIMEDAATGAALGLADSANPTLHILNTARDESMQIDYNSITVSGNNLDLHGSGDTADPRITFNSGNTGYIEWQEDELQFYIDQALEIASWLNVGGIGNFTGGITTEYSDDNVADPPTDTELDTAFDTPANLGSGFIGVLDDNSADTDVYICWTTDASWFYVKGTKAVNP